MSPYIWGNWCQRNHVGHVLGVGCDELGAVTASAPEDPASLVPDASFRSCSWPCLSVLARQGQLDFIRGNPDTQPVPPLSAPPPPCEIRLRKPGPRDPVQTYPDSDMCKHTQTAGREGAVHSNCLLGSPSGGSARPGLGGGRCPPREGMWPASAGSRGRVPRSTLYLAPHEVQ